MAFFVRERPPRPARSAISRQAVVRPEAPATIAAVAHPPLNSGYQTRVFFHYY